MGAEECRTGRMDTDVNTAVNTYDVATLRQRKQDLVLYAYEYACTLHEANQKAQTLQYRSQ